jgi:hypothetical protein
MRKIAKRIVLSKETLRRLDEPRLAGVAGGATNVRSVCQGSCHGTCPNTTCGPLCR